LKNDSSANNNSQKHETSPTPQNLKEMDNKSNISKSNLSVHSAQKSIDFLNYGPQHERKKSIISLGSDHTQNAMNQQSINFIK